MDPAVLIHFFNCLILRALDAEDTDRLRRLIAQLGAWREIEKYERSQRVCDFGDGRVA